MLSQLENALIVVKKSHTLQKVYATLAMRGEDAHRERFRHQDLLNVMIVNKSNGLNIRIDVVIAAAFSEKKR